jgi:NaMN:DMB phosphoribosyltransferase
MKKQLHHDPEPVIAQEQSLSKAIVAGIILSFAILGIAVLLGGHY